jgi:hypothetical protein
MGRVLTGLVLALLLASCGGGYKAPPDNLENACSILDQRPQYKRAFKKTERRWGAPTHVQMALIYYESSFRSNARTPHRYALGVLPMGRQSSAFGYSQAIDGTWEDYKRATGRNGARRDRMRDASDFIGWYLNETYERHGVPKDDARRQYLAYHEGHGGFARGSYRSKSWLMRTADKVQARSEMYERQLASC